MYKYKHENGKIIEKADFIVRPISPHSYFEGPYVLYWVHINDTTGLIDLWWPYSLSEEKKKEFIDAKQD